MLRVYTIYKSSFDNFRDAFTCSKRHEKGNEFFNTNWDDIYLSQPCKIIKIDGEKSEKQRCLKNLKMRLGRKTVGYL